MKRTDPMFMAFECVLAGIIVFLIAYFWRKTSLTYAVVECLLVIAGCGVGSWFRYKRLNNK